MKKKQNREVLGRDISRPMDTMELDGQVYPLAHDLNSFRIAEDVYELQYGRNVNFGEIATHLAAGKIGAIMAVLYGALVSGGLSISWQEFSSKFRLTDIPGFRDQLLKNVKDALPEVDGNTSADKADPQ